MASRQQDRSGPHLQSVDLEELRRKADVQVTFQASKLEESAIIQVNNFPWRDHKSEQNVPFELVGQTWILRVISYPNTALLARQGSFDIMVINPGDQGARMSLDFGVLKPNGELLGTRWTQGEEEILSPYSTSVPDIQQRRSFCGLTVLEHSFFHEFGDFVEQNRTISFNVRVCMRIWSVQDKVVYGSREGAVASRIKNVQATVHAECQEADSNSKPNGTIFLTLPDFSRSDETGATAIVNGRMYEFVYQRSPFIIEFLNLSSGQVQLHSVRCMIIASNGSILATCQDIPNIRKSLPPYDPICGPEWCSISDWSDPGNLVGLNPPLHVFLEIKENCPFVSKHHSVWPVSCRKHESSLAADWAELLESDKNSDVNFVVEGQSFRAHRAVLAARCPVPIAHERMLEGTSKCDIVIDDASAPVFKAFLRYLYCDEVQESALATLGIGLLRIADKYCLEDLKMTCAQYLWKHVTSDDVWDVLMIAKELEHDQLLRKCQGVVASSWSKVLSSAGYQETLMQAPALANEILIECATATQTVPISDSESVSGTKRMRLR